MDAHDAQQAAMAIETTASGDQQAARARLVDLFRSSPLPTEDLLFNLGLYTRSSLLVKFLVLSEIYERFMHVPGLICEFGTWWGQNLVLLENLRAIHEPFNKQRRIVGFDTFEGYTPAGQRDKKSDVWQEHSYSTGTGWMDQLRALLRTHEQSNVLGNISDVHELVQGDVALTAPAWFAARPESIVAFAYFDMGLYEPTRASMEAIRPHLVPGSCILLDELTWSESPGEAIAFKEVFGRAGYRLERLAKYPSKALVTIL